MGKIILSNQRVSKTKSDNKKYSEVWIKPYENVECLDFKLYYYIFIKSQMSPPYVDQFDLTDNAMLIV